MMQSIVESNSRANAILGTLDGNGNGMGIQDGSKIGGLISNLAHNHIDINSDLSTILEGFQSGHIASSDVVTMIDTEQVRSHFLMKMMNAMRVQLGGVFGIVDSLLENGYSAHGDDPLTNSLYLEFEESLETIEYVESILNASSMTLNKEIGSMETFIESLVSKPKCQVRPVIHEEKKDDDEYKTEEETKLNSKEQDPVDRKTKKFQNIVKLLQISSQSALKKLSMSTEKRMVSTKSAHQVQSKKFVETSSQTIVDDIEKTVDKLPEPSSTGDFMQELSITGSRKIGSSREITRAKALIAEKLLALNTKEAELDNRQLLLDEREEELREVALRVASHESRAISKIKEAEEIVAQNTSVASTPLSQPQQNNDVDLEDTKNFLETSIKDAQSKHDQESNDALNFKANMLMVEGHHTDASGLMPVSSKPIKTNMHELDQSSTEEQGMGSILGPNIKAKVELMSPVNIPPPQASILPDMMVIFPPRTTDRGTDTNDLIHLMSSIPKEQRIQSARTPIKSMILTSRHQPTNKNSDKSAKNETNGDNIQKKSSVGTSKPIDDELESHLPIVSADPMGLVTRTYRHIDPRDFRKEIIESENPLLTIYEEYKDCIPDVFRSSLLDASTGSSTVRTSTAISNLFGSILPDVQKLDTTSSIILKELASCEEMANNIIMVNGSGEIADDLYFRGLTQLYKKLGEIDTLKLWIDVQLGQYRSIFEKINSLSISMLPNLMKNSSSFEDSYEAFVSCSGRQVEAQGRFTALKERCKRYQIASSFSNINGGQRSDQSLGYRVNIEEYLNLQNEVELLRQQLIESEEETESLNLEVFRAMQEGDRTPGALMFFSALHDPVTINIIQQVILQLTNVKGFADGSSHMDFSALRKRLQVCLSCVPTMERFVHRYSSLHKKWCLNRLGMFTSKGQVGGGSDAANLCPMCSNDNAKFAPPANSIMARRGIQTGKGGAEEMTGAPKVQTNQKVLRARNGQSKKIKENFNNTMTDSIASHSHSQSSLPSIKIPM